jgi:hypothetical protein
MRFSEREEMKFEVPRLANALEQLANRRRDER